MKSAQQALLLSVAYFIAAGVGIALTREANSIATLWPANAVLLAMLLRSPRHTWHLPVIGCASANVLVNLIAGDTAQIAIGFMICNMAETLTAGLVLKRFHDASWDLGSHRQAIAFGIIAGIAAPAVGASLGGWLIYLAYGASYWPMWMSWWIGDAMGFLIITPALITMNKGFLNELAQDRPGESAALLFTVIVVTAAVFSQLSFPLVYLVTPIMLWAAFRLNVLGAAVSALLISSIAVAMTIYGHGPIPLITEGKMADRVQFLQLYLGVAVLMPMIVAILLAEQKRAEEALQSEKERAEVTLQSIGDAVITTDEDGLIRFINPVAEEITGWSQQDAIGQPVDTIFNIIDEEDGTPAESPVARCMEHGLVVGLGNHTILLSRDGKEHSIQDSTAPMWDADSNLKGVVLVFSDVTEARRLAREATHQAAHDSLTGLVNRREFEKRLQRALASAKEEFNEHMLIYLDLDQFKIVNDTKGHVAGDELLRQLAVLLKSHMRHRDTLARLGGDEFGILMEHCPPAKGAAVAESLQRVIREFQFLWADQSFRIGASMGLVPIDATCGDITEIMRRADAACYAAKDEGRNRIHLYRDDDKQLRDRHGEMQWVGRIQRALDEDRFRLFCQPIRSLKADSAVLRYEILLRLEDEEGRIIPPGAFLPAAERYDLASKIDRWVIDHTFWWLSNHPKHVADLQHCAINISGQSLKDGKLAAYIRERIQDSGVPAEKLCFEVTETAAIANLRNASRLLTSLKDLGCRVALDDFGSGLSSFGYLKNLPVDFLKIDGVFVRGIATDQIDYAMVKSISEIGRVMQKATIAEFVENAAILERLQELGVDCVQGFHVGGPEPIEAMLAGNVYWLPRIDNE